MITSNFVITQSEKNNHKNLFMNILNDYDQLSPNEYTPSQS